MYLPYSGAMRRTMGAASFTHTNCRFCLLAVSMEGATRLFYRSRMTAAESVPALEKTALSAGLKLTHSLVETTSGAGKPRG